jgi:DNA-binding helix-hairpin-helix protein with protein kinase domain
MSRPPGTLTLPTFGESITRLFEQAFAAPSDSHRPTATQWIGALQALEHELVECQASRVHFHPRAAATCCWCTLEQGTGVKLFGGRSPRSDAGGTAELAQIWDTISAIPKPAAESPLEAPDVNELDCEARDALGPWPRLLLTALLAVLGGLSFFFGKGIAMAMTVPYLAGAFALGWEFRKPEWRRERRQELYRAMFAARLQLGAVVERWNEVCSDEAFTNLFDRLEETKRKLIELGKEREERMKQLVDDAARLQRERFLDLHRIDKARLPRVTQQDVAKLGAYGIETAADVLQSAGELHAYILESTADEVVEWAEKRAMEFRFDPSMPAAGDDIRDLDDTLQLKREQLLATLRQGAQELERVAATLSTERAAAQAELASARNALSKVAEGAEA